MIVALPLLLGLIVADSQVYNGRTANIAVRPPRAAAEIVVDGRLDEPIWKQAALLNGFSQFSPQDGIRAADSTQVLVWYSATAIHFGVRADLLLAYTPQPGTVVYLGYGARLLEPQSFRFERLNRTSDALFLKLSYLFRN